jgi:DNA polymerase III epsilon subunit-like protein
MIILLDFETTGLILPSSSDLVLQPRIIEIGAIKVSDRGSVVAELGELIDPRQEISAEITKITGIKPEQLKGKRTIEEVIPELADFFLGAHTLVAHNVAFDRDVLYFELLRTGWERRFPFPPNQVCTVDSTMHIKGRRMKLTELYEHTQGKPLAQTHRAVDDVRALWECYKALNDNKN